MIWFVIKTNSTQKAGQQSFKLSWLMIWFVIDVLLKNRILQDSFKLSWLMIWFVIYKGGKDVTQVAVSN